MISIGYPVRCVSVVNFTGFRANWGCQATSWGLVDLLNGAMPVPDLPHLRPVPLLGRNPADLAMEQQRDQIHHAIEDVANTRPGADAGLRFLETLCTQRYGRYAQQVRHSDLVVLQAEGTMAGTDIVRGARLLLLPFVARHAWKKPVIAMNQTIYSCDDDFTRVLAAAYNSFDMVAVRENISFDAARRAGIRDVLHIPDAAFLVRPRPGGQGLATPGHFAVSGTAYEGAETYSRLIAIADHLRRETGLRPLVLVSASEDRALVDQARQLWGDGGFDTLPTEAPHSVVASVLQRCRFLLGGRYHMAIMAAAMATPVIQLPGNTYKNEGLSAMLDGLMPVRQPEDLAAITADAAAIMEAPDRARDGLRAAVAPLHDRLQVAAQYLAQVQQGEAVAAPDLLRHAPGQAISASDHLPVYRANSIRRAEGFSYHGAAGVGGAPAPRDLFEARLDDLQAGDQGARSSLIQMMKSFPGAPERARPTLREAIYRLPLDVFRDARVPRPPSEDAQMRTLEDIQRVCGPDLQAMCDRIVPGQPAPHRPRAADLAVHLATLREEFGGSPELLFYHAALITLIRRGQDDAAIAKFRALWAEMPDFLCARLNARWLVSACDTFADISRGSSEGTTALLGSVLINTVKLYETEREALGISDESANYRSMAGPPPLHDGLTAYGVGGGEMVGNLLDRIRVAALSGGAPGRIVGELLTRTMQAHTAYARLAPEGVRAACAVPPR